MEIAVDVVFPFRLPAHWESKARDAWSMKRPPRCWQVAPMGVSAYRASNSRGIAGGWVHHCMNLKGRWRHPWMRTR